MLSEARKRANKKYISEKNRWYKAQSKKGIKRKISVRSWKKRNKYDTVYYSMCRKGNNKLD